MKDQVKSIAKLTGKVFLVGIAKVTEMGAQQVQGQLGQEVLNSLNGKKPEPKPTKKGKK